MGLFVETVDHQPLDDLRNRFRIHCCIVLVLIAPEEEQVTQNVVQIVVVDPNCNMYYDRSHLNNCNCNHRWSAMKQ